MIDNHLPGKYITVYDKCNYSGKQFNLKPGVYGQSQFNSTMYKKVSSIKIPPGFIVKVFTGDDFNGTTAIYTKSVACLDSVFNNNIGSVIIEQVGSRPVGSH
ncbi:hypothetical protein SAMN06265350_1113 [Solitalea koreensis]|uniref:Beta/gamma crystallin 'Greek key' domain-containing protein n=2 Tax=Solitalea koreensis TaxID=543615 RepID=A0A521E3G2_9SPHI|nr:hypothetical protein SAMN06265350_1113 [Solitalea koreensis]